MRIAPAIPREPAAEPADFEASSLFQAVLEAQYMCRIGVNPIMEIERKFLIDKIPPQAAAAAADHLEQAYVSTSPVIRIRRKNDSYILTVKSQGLLAREEFELAISQASYDHLMKKKDGMLITKDRLNIPLSGGLTCELDVFSGSYEGLMMAEVEFPDLQTARSFTPPAWFGREVTEDSRFQNASLCMNTQDEARQFMDDFRSMLSTPR